VLRCAVKLGQLLEPNRPILRPTIDASFHVRERVAPGTIEVSVGLVLLAAATPRGVVRLTRVALSPTGSKRTTTKVRCARAPGRWHDAFQSNEVIFFGARAMTRMPSAPFVPDSASGSV
jgi:hypothetical protein